MRIRKKIRHISRKYKKRGLKGGTKTRKRVSFGDPIISEFENEFISIDNTNTIYPDCPSFKHIRGHHFPCRYKNTIFENQKEFGEWYLEEIKNLINKKKEKDSHKRRIKSEQLSMTGNWNRYIAPEFRTYTEEGIVENIFPFSELTEEESERLLQEKRKERSLSQRKWLEDVKNYKTSYV